MAISLTLIQCEISTFKCSIFIIIGIGTKYKYIFKKPNKLGVGIKTITIKAAVS